MTWKKPLVIVLLALGAFSSPSIVRANYTADQVIGQYDPVALTQRFTSIAANNGPNPFGFKTPVGVCVDTTHHRLFVGDFGNNRVLVFALGADDKISGRDAVNVLGQTDMYSFGASSTATGFNGPEDCVYDSAHDRLFVVDNANNRILEFELSGGISNGMAATHVIGQAGFGVSGAATTATGFSGPQSVTYDPVGQRLYVADFANNRVMVFNLAGGIADGMAASAVIGQTSFIVGSGVSAQNRTINPNGVVFDSTTNRLFVNEFSGNRVKIWDFDISPLASTGTNAYIVLGQSTYTGTGVGTTATTMSGSDGVAIDTAGQRLFVSDRTNKRVLVFDATPGVLASGSAATNVLGQSDFVSVNASLSADRFLQPIHSMAYVPTSKQLFVVDFAAHRLSVFDTTTITNGQAAVDELGHKDSLGNTNFNAMAINGGGVAARAVSNVGAVGFDPAGQYMHLLDFGNCRDLLFALNADGTLQDTIADHVIGQPDFFTSTCLHTASSIGFQPVITSTIGSGPADITFGPNQFFVSDIGNNRVLEYDTGAGVADGMSAAHVLGQSNFTNRNTGLTRPTMNSPDAMEYDFTRHRLFVADRGNRRILVYDLTGGIVNGASASFVLGQNDFVTAASTPSKKITAFPIGLALDEAGNRLFVSDFTSHRVLVWDFNLEPLANGASASFVLGQTTFTAASPGTTQSTMRNPARLSYDSTDKLLFVPDDLNNRILVFDANTITNGKNAMLVIGQSDFASASAGATASKFSNPVATTFDASNRYLYVSEGSGNRVLRFPLPRLTTQTFSAFTGTSFNTSIPTSGTVGSVTYTKTSGTLPAGVTLAGTGVLSGTPTESGNFTFSVVASDSLGAAGSMKSNTQSYTLTVSAPSGGSACSGTLAVGVSVSGGSASPVDASLLLDGAGMSRDSTYTMSCGAHIVSTTALSGYTQSWTGDCASDGSVYIDRGLSKTCTAVFTFGTPLPTPTPTLTPTPPPSVGGSLSAYNLHEGDTISASGSSDPDVYIVNIWGYKRLFLNPVIFEFYGHLKSGWALVKSISPVGRDSFPTSGLFRNCETNDPKVYGLEVTGEDTGMLHWINMSGDSAVAEDSEFFKKVFCINTKELTWYTQGSPWTSLSQVPNYQR